MDNERLKPASSRTENLPELLSITQLEAFLLENFPKHPRVKWYFVTPEELCDIVEKYANVIQAHWKEGANPPLAKQMVWVTLFNKGRSGANIKLTGLLEFTPQYARTYCKNEGIDPATHCVNIGWDTSHSEFSVEFEGEEEQRDDTKIYRHTQQEWAWVS